jgi:hypothetical protein
MRRARTAAIAAAVLLLAPAAPARANDECVGVVTGVFERLVVPEGAFCTLTNSHVLGDVQVFAGARLEVRETTVGGSVHGTRVQWVQMLDNTRVDGSVVINEAVDPGASIVMLGGSVGASFKVAQSRAGVFFASEAGGDVWITGSSGSDINVSGTVRGHVLVADNTAAFINPSGAIVSGGLVVRDNVAGDVLQVAANEVTGDIAVMRNRGPAQKEVSGNVINGNLECFDNDPPFVGGPNTATNAQGQCF